VAIVFTFSLQVNPKTGIRGLFFNSHDRRPSTGAGSRGLFLGTVAAALIKLCDDFRQIGVALSDLANRVDIQLK